MFIWFGVLVNLLGIVGYILLDKELQNKIKKVYKKVLTFKTVRFMIDLVRRSNNTNQSEVTENE
jgi:hypothetical protein